MSAKNLNTKTRESKNRRVKPVSYKSFRLSKRIKHPAKPIANSARLLQETIRLIRINWKFFLGVFVINGLLSFIFIKSASVSLDLVSLKQTITGVLGGSSGLASGTALFGILLGNSLQTGNQTVGTYQAILLITMSLVLIFGLRHMDVTNKKILKVKVKTAFYEGMAPLIPFLLVLLIVGLQLIPASAGASIYSTVASNGLAVNSLEQVVWALLALCLTLLSLYMVTSSLFALYIVTLPGMTPLKSLRAARGLVKYRRWMVLRKVVVLPLLMLLALALIVIPVIAYLPNFAEATFFIATLAILPIAHAYYYNLYRKLV